MVLSRILLPPAAPPFPLADSLPSLLFAVTVSFRPQGKILPEHLRAGLDVRREEGKTLLDW
jgi:hypothetical protein